MKVLFVSQYPDGPNAVCGGVGGACYALASEIASRPGVVAHVLNPFSPSAHMTNANLDGVAVTSWPIWKGAFYTRLSYARRCRAIARFVDDGGYDLVHVQGEPTLGRMIRAKRVLTIHGIQERDASYSGWKGRLRGWFLRFRESYFRSRFQDIILVNPYVRQVVGNVGRVRMWSICNPVRPSFFGIERDAIPGRVFVGSRVTPLKNVEGIIRSFASVTNDAPRAELRIAGPETSPKYSATCKQLAIRLGVADRVTFLGPLPPSQVRDELSRASIAAICSFQEVAPLAIAEAMAAGVPVLASKVCGLQYMVQDNVTGVLVDPYDPNDMARGMKQLLTDTDALAMWEACKNDAERLYRVSSVADKTLDVYRQVRERQYGC